MSTDRNPRRNAALRGLRPLFVDGVAPVALYFGLTALGVADLLALLAGAAVAAADAVVSLAVERRLRPLPIYVCCVFVLTGGLAYVTHDPRMVLLKGSIASLAIGVYLLALSARPSTLHRALAPLIARGSEARAARWREGWDERASVRNRIRLACAFAGLLLLAESAARTAIVFHFTIGQSLFLAHAPAIVLIVAFVVIARLLVVPAVVEAMGDLSIRRR